MTKKQTEYLERALSNYRFIIAQKRPSKNQLHHYLTSMACSIKLALKDRRPR